MTMKRNSIGKKGMTTPSDFTEFIIGLILIVIGLVILFSVGKWLRVETEDVNVDAVVGIQAQRNSLHYLRSPVFSQVGGYATADAIILSEYDLPRRQVLKDMLEKNLGSQYLVRFLEIRSASDIGEFVAVSTRFPTNRIIPASILLPSLDGGLITVELKESLGGEWTSVNS